MSVRAKEALVALRQIQRRIEIDARHLARETGLAPSQLRVLQILDEAESVTIGDIARSIGLTNATTTSLVDKMEARGLVKRTRCDTDRRKVWLELLPAGTQALQDTPHDLQKMFESRYASLETWEQAMLVAALEKLSFLLDAETLDVAPILAAGEIDQKPKPE